MDSAGSFSNWIIPAGVICYCSCLSRDSLNQPAKPCKPDHMQWHTWTLGGCVEEWHIPRKTVSALLITITDCRTMEHLTSDSFGDISWVQKATLQLYRSNVQLLHTSKTDHVHCMWSVLPGLPLRQYCKQQILEWEDLGMRLGCVAGHS